MSEEIKKGAVIVHTRVHVSGDIDMDICIDKNEVAAMLEKMDKTGGYDGFTARRALESHITDIAAQKVKDIIPAYARHSINIDDSDLNSIIDECMPESMEKVWLYEFRPIATNTCNLLKYLTCVYDKTAVSKMRVFREWQYEPVVEGRPGRLAIFVCTTRKFLKQMNWEGDMRFAISTADAEKRIFQYLSADNAYEELPVDKEWK